MLPPMTHVALVTRAEVMSAETGRLAAPPDSIGQRCDAINAQVYAEPDIARRYARRRELSRAETVALLAWHEAWADRDVLDVAVGSGRTARWLAPRARSYIGVDFSPPMIAHVRALLPDLDVRLADMRSLSMIADASIDFVLISDNAIDAVDPDGRTQTLSEARRVLRPGGMLMYNSHNLGWQHAGQPPRLHPRLGLRATPAAWRHWLEARRNHRRLQPLCRDYGTFAILTDSGHAFSLLHYYTRHVTEQRQLQRAGFELLATYDPDGRRLDPEQDDAHAAHLMFVARRLD